MKEVERIEGSLHLYGDANYIYQNIIQECMIDRDMEVSYWHSNVKTDKITKMNYSYFLDRYKGKKVEIDEEIVFHDGILEG